MSGWYRIGAPGADTVAHLNTGRKSSGEKCPFPAFELDNKDLGKICGRMSVALCDARACDKPMCELHRTKAPLKANTDYCPDHESFAGREFIADQVEKAKARLDSTGQPYTPQLQAAIEWLERNPA